MEAIGKFIRNIEQPDGDSNDDVDETVCIPHAHWNIEVLVFTHNSHLVTSRDALSECGGVIAPCLQNDEILPSGTGYDDQYG